jgi:inosine-uridine nucleoside N-ribohydrolase
LVQKLIIDADPGIADTLAILTAMADPSVELMAVTATGGAVSGIQATRNLHSVISLIDPVRHPRIGQCNRPAAINDALPEIAQAWRRLNGEKGLGTAEIKSADLHNRRESARLIVDIAREHPGEICLLTLGPLSNLALATDLDPQLPEYLHSVVTLGGSVQVGGDVTASAEFNIWADAAAARVVCQLPVQKTLVPLDVSLQPALSFDDVDVMCSFFHPSEVSTFTTNLLQFAIRGHRQYAATEGIPLQGVAALAVAARAEAFQLEGAVVDVETTGELTLGATVVDRRPTRSHRQNFSVVASIDDLGVVDYFARAVRRICCSSN